MKIIQCHSALPNHSPLVSKQGPHQTHIGIIHEDSQHFDDVSMENDAMEKKTKLRFGISQPGLMTVGYPLVSSLLPKHQKTFKTSKIMECLIDQPEKNLKEISSN